MKKNILVVLIFLFLICPNTRVDALKPLDITSRVECPNIELAEAKEDGSLVKVECYDDFNLAKGKMYETPNDNLVLIEQGKIIDAKYALVDYDADFTNASTKYVRVYANSSGNSEVGYIRTAGNYADDAVLLDYDNNTKRVKIKISGLVGWIGKNDNSAVIYDIVPLAWVKSPQYYDVTNDSISHGFPGNVYGEKGAYSIGLDLKPEMLNPGRYYSYDGHYFYTDMKVLINDYKAGNYNNSVNKDNPYFNYYQYLSFRTKSNYVADNINQFLRSRISNDTSKLLNTGASFAWVQDNYGVNAILMMAIGINESGWGNSAISQSKNNLFGLNAVDSTPGESANYFPNVDTCIKDYGYKWLSYWYLQPGDSHYRGANLGNKYEGLNVKYASDPFWGEHAAHYYYEMDKYFGFQDRDKNLAVLNNNYNDVVYARKSPNGELIRIYDRNEFYQYKTYGTGISIISEVTTEDGNVWYKIQSEPVLDQSLNYIGESTSNPRINYNFGSYVYVEAKYFIKVKTAAYIPQESVNTNQTNEQSTQPQTVPVSSIVNNSSFRYETGIIAGIKIGTSTDSLVNNIASHGGINISIIASNGTPKTGKLGTGDKITITSGNTTETLEVVVAGDLTGDGEINSADLLRVRQHLLGQSLTGVYEKAAYMGYSAINSANLLKIRQYLLGQTDIN